MPWLCLYAAGVWFLFRAAVHVFGENLSDLWVYSRSPQHRFTAMSMLTGALTLHASVGHAGHDEQVFNGSGYTNWGYGVPLLQLPFQAVAQHVRAFRPQRFFPDRAIFFSYLAVSIPIVWAGFDRLFAMRVGSGAAHRVRRHAVSWSATAFVLVTTLYALLASRFIIYEETVAYFVMVQLVTCAAFVFAVDERANAGAIIAFGAAAGMGLLVRPTGLIYLAVWAGTLLLERRSRRVVVAFAAGVAPFLLFWMVTNWVRTGMPWSTGLSNILPAYDKQIPMVRFGSQCTDTPRHAVQVALRLFSAIFSGASDDTSPWLKQCHFELEAHNGDSLADTQPFIGMAALLFLVWTFAHHVARRDVRLDTYLPHLGVVLVFGAYAYAGAGFAWRYVADFWPFFVLVGVQYVRRMRLPGGSLLGWPMAAVTFAGAIGCYKQAVDPWKSIVQKLDETGVRTMWDDFANFRWTMDKPMPSAIKCGQVPDWPWHNGRGWGSGCQVDTYTDVFVGVPPKEDDAYAFRFRTDGVTADSLRVYVNGRVYTARRVGVDTFAADVKLRYPSLHSPIVLTTIEWTRALEPPPWKLLEVQIT